MNLDLELNKQQRKAVTKKDGAALVVSGAGSGKTRVITYRTAYLIKEGINPRNILVLTFTNKAADNMEKRINKMLNNKNTGDLWIGTFHSIGCRILSNNLDKIGYNDGFTIYDPKDVENLLTEILDELNIAKDFIDPQNVKNIISDAKINLIDPKNLYQYMIEKKDVIETKAYSRKIANVYKIYQERLEDNNAFDFGDLIMKTINLFVNHPKIKKKYQDRFKYVMIDEYQDTNLSQYRFASLLSQPENNIMAVGDVDQSIYKFRGADIRNILEFEKAYPQSETIKLERNYRSTKNIVNASNKLIEKNTERRDKIAWTDENPGSKIKLITNPSSQAEAKFIVKTIRSLKSHYNYNDIAIFYRSHFLSNEIENAFVNHNIPYQVVGSYNFLNRAEIKMFLSLVKIGINPEDNLTIAKVINKFNNDVGRITIKRLKKYSRKNSLALHDVMYNPENVKGVGKKRAKAIKAFLNNYIKPLMKVISNDDLNLFEKLEKIYKKYIKSIMQSFSSNVSERHENILELLNSGKKYSENNPTNDINDFIEYLSLMNDQDDVDENDQSVKLMTVHASKGLEFPIVFTIGLEENLFPHRLSLQDGEVEEERRLFYVAMTRAKEKLYLSHCLGRFKFGKWSEQTQSRFLSEIPKKYLQKIHNGTEEQKFQKEESYGGLF